MDVPSRMENPITITIPHRLSRGEAKARVQESVDRLKQQFGGAGFGHLAHQWVNDRLDMHARALGQVVTGRIHVNDHDVKIEVDLPGILGAFANKIAARLRHEGTLLLEKK
jgi:hypothetical protein